MKQRQINVAYGALKRLSTMQFPVKTAYGLYTLLRQIEDIYQFELQQEKKLLGKYNGELTSNGRVVFGDKESEIEFAKEVRELNDMEVDVVISPITVSFDSFSDYALSPSDIANLEGFVVFE